MTRIAPTPREELPQYEKTFQLVEGAMGFVPSSMRTMAKIPALFEAFSGLAATITLIGEIEPGLAQMIANVASTASGCRYCQAHTAAHAAHAGVDTEKIEKVWEFETSDLFTEAERAALRVARDAAQNPNAVTNDEFADLERHYSENQIIQIVATIGLFGYLNRWNDTMATTLEPEPLEFAGEHLSASGWEAGKHAPAGPVS
jgi:uncharacterized peroxidase-related enzyme